MNNNNSSHPDSKSGALVTGLFPDRDSAETAYRAAHEQGYTKDDINLVMSNETRGRYFSGTTAGRETELGNKAAEGAGIGGVIGGTVGAITAAIAAVGTTLALPGLGLVIAGPLTGAVTGAGVGAADGGLLGALVGWNMPEERVKAYEQGVKSGGNLIGLRTRNDHDATHLEAQWKAQRGGHVYC